MIFSENGDWNISLSFILEIMTKHGRVGTNLLLSLQGMKFMGWYKYKKGRELIKE